MKPTKHECLVRTFHNIPVLYDSEKCQVIAYRKQDYETRPSVRLFLLSTPNGRKVLHQETLNNDPRVRILDHADAVEEYWMMQRHGTCFETWQQVFGKFVLREA
jgi:hypothetical protein